MSRSDLIKYVATFPLWEIYVVDSACFVTHSPLPTGGRSKERRPKTPTRSVLVLPWYFLLPGWENGENGVAQMAHEAVGLADGDQPSVHVIVHATRRCQRLAEPRSTAAERASGMA